MLGAATLAGERLARRHVHDETLGGAATAAAIIALGAAYGAVAGCSGTLPALACAASGIAIRSLLEHAHAVLEPLQQGRLDDARVALSRCVGRDTNELDVSGVTRATIEMLAESLCDGIVAPLLYLALGGCAGLYAYKAANTLDSLIGHVEAPYTRFGSAAARLDDAANYLPARVAAALVAVCAPFGSGSVEAAVRVWIRDGGKHRSPNAGRPEAAMAGALGVRLGGPVSYDGIEHHAERLGDELWNAPIPDDGVRALRIVAAASAIAIAGAVLLAWATER